MGKLQRICFKQNYHSFCTISYKDHYHHDIIRLVVAYRTWKPSEFPKVAVWIALNIQFAFPNNFAKQWNFLILALNFLAMQLFEKGVLWSDVHVYMNNSKKALVLHQKETYQPCFSVCLIEWSRCVPLFCHYLTASPFFALSSR